MVVARYHTADNEWHPNTRATHHLTNNANNIHMFNDDDNSQDHIQVANGAGLDILHSGSSTFSSPSKSFLLKQILCVPEINKNLLSVHRFYLDNNVFFEFHASFFLMKDYLGNILHRGPLSNGLYTFSASLAHLQPQGISSIHVSAQLWHRRLGHASFPVINKAISIAPRNKLTSICSDCQLAKSHAIPFKHVHVSVLKPLELIYSDVWGPAPVLSTTGARYYISFLDDATKYLWLFPLKLKSDAYPTFLNFQTVVERQFDTKIKALQSDWGGEFRSLNKYLHSQGINHRITCPYTHQQAGAIERHHRQIVEVGLSLLAHSKLPQKF
jgi:histone deacetylase 1/2